MQHYSGSVRDPSRVPSVSPSPIRRTQSAFFLFVHRHVVFVPKWSHVDRERKDDDVFQSFQNGALLIQYNLCSGAFGTTQGDTV
jgi:hypothetical protein